MTAAEIGGPPGFYEGTVGIAYEPGTGGNAALLLAVVVGARRLECRTNPCQRLAASPAPPR